MMFSKINFKKTISWTIIIILWFFIAYLLIGGSLKQRSLKMHKKETIAVIYEFISIRYTDYFRYEFVIDSKLYKGSGYHYKNIDKVSVGDSICIVYDKTNPNNNKSCRDFH